MEGTTTKSDLRRSSRVALISARERNSLLLTRTRHVVKKEEDDEKKKKNVSSRQGASKRIPRSRRLTLTEYKTMTRRLGHFVEEAANSNDYFSVNKSDEKWRPLITFPEGDVSISDESSVSPMVVSPRQSTTPRFIPRPASSSPSSSYSHSSSSSHGYSDSETETPLPALYTPIKTDIVAVQKLFAELTKSREKTKEEENETDAESYFDFDVAEEQEQ